MTIEPRNLKTPIYENFTERNRKAEEWSEDRVIASLIQSARPMILDIGAYTGTSAIRFRNLFPQSRLVCFEPNPAARAELEATTAQLGGDIRVSDVAISDTDGTTKFIVQGINPGLSGLVRRNLQSRDSIALSQGGNVDTSQINLLEIEVRTSRLDSIDYLKTERVDLMKIDVQSCEAKVLRGAQGVLARTEVMIVEVSFYDLYENQSSFRAIEGFTEPAGLKLWAITTHSRNPMNGRTDWVNVVYSRN